MIAGGIVISNGDGVTLNKTKQFFSKFVCSRKYAKRYSIEEQIGRDLVISLSYHCRTKDDNRRMIDRSSGRIYCEPPNPRTTGCSPLRLRRLIANLLSYVNAIGTRTRVRAPTTSH
jgi:hypothetical protein